MKALHTITLLVVPALVPAGAEPITVARELPDAELLRLVDPTAPGLRPVRDAMQAGHLTQARDLLIEYFRTRELPVIPPARFPGSGSGNSMIILRPTPVADADAWLKHTFTLSNNDAGRLETYSLGQELRWMANPSPALSWNLYLNQLNVVNGLAYVYRETADEKYAAEAGRMVQTWTEQCYSGYGYTRDGKPISSGMEVRNRLCNCLVAYDVLRHSSALTPDMHMAFYRLFVASCRELLTYAGVSYPGLIPAALLYPEFTESRRWLGGGEDDIRHALVNRTTPEGAWDTHSVAYQTVPVPWALRSLEFLEASPAAADYGDLARMIREQTGKLQRLMLWCMMPNGGLPNIGDTYGRSDWGMRVGSHVGSYVYTQLAEPLQARVNAIDSVYDRALAVLAGHEGSDGPQPRTTSIGFPGSGYYVMRKNWEIDNAPYLYFDLTPQKLGHAHWDAGHFDLYAYGKPLLCDTGDYFLGWGYRTGLHNTIEVDGERQAWGAEMLPCEWLSTDAFDWVDGAHAGYIEKGVLHRRKLFYAKDASGEFADYWVLCDLLTGTGTHTYEQFFHFGGPTQQLGAVVRVDSDTKAAQSLHEEVANVRIIPIHTDDLGVALVEAKDTTMLKKDCYDRDAMLGWIVTTGTHRRAKSAVAVYTRTGEAPATFNDVLFPTPPGATAQVTVTGLPVTENGRRVDPATAMGVEIHCRLTRPTYVPGDIVLDRGSNLAIGRPAAAAINRTSFPEAGGGRLTDGNRGATRIGAALSSVPYTPGSELSGTFAVDLGDPRPVNLVVAHHGTFNGQGIIYPPEEMAVEYLDGETWVEVPNPSTTWLPDMATRTMFRTVTTTGIRVRVARPSGGRLAMREIEVYRVSQAERRRIETLQAQTTTSEWTDYLLVSHAGPTRRTYGRFTFDGELAFLRKDADGRLRQLSVKHGAHLTEEGAERFSARVPVPYLTAVVDGDIIRVDSPATQGRVGPLPVRVPTDARWRVRLPEPTTPPLVIAAATVQLHPAQDGLAGGQPWALVRWRTDRPATTQVQYQGTDGVRRRTPMNPQQVTEHEARAEFLRAGMAYVFTAVSSADGQTQTLRID